MKKFVKNLIIFFVILGLITEIVNFAYVKKDHSDRYNTDKYTSMPDHLEICNMGSSHTAYGISYHDFKERYDCFNFALESQSLSYDLRIFENYKDKIDENTIVIIPVSYASLFGPDEIKLSDFESKNKRYYSILKKDYIKEYDFSTDLFVHYLPALSVETGVLVQALMGKRNSSHFDDNRTRTLFDIDLKTNAEHAYTRHFVDFIYDSDHQLQPNENEIIALKNLISACHEQGAQPVLITTPLHESYLKEVQENEPDFIPVFNAMVADIVAETGIPYYDYSQDSRFKEAPDLFMDTDHLNENGARMFTDLLLDSIL